MSGSVLVPNSPTKHSVPVFRAPGWSTLTSTASSSRLARPVEPPARPLAFLASSADAYRAAAKKRRLPPQAKAFKHDNQASYAKTAEVKQKPHLPGANRDDSLQIIETLTPGPKNVAAKPDDLHFKKLEPTSGIALRNRFVPHAELEAHLDGRYYVPISKLYCIAQEGKCDDGQYSIPVEGDWMTMGVVVKKGAVARTKEKHFDAMGRLEEDYVKVFGQGSNVEGPNPEEDGKKKEIVTGKGETKKFGPREFLTLTLLDISNPPNEYGEHSGDNEIQVTVFEAESTWLEPGGERKYAGGSFGAFEKLRDQELGAVLCLLNPKINKVKRWKDNPWKDGVKWGPTPVKQSPRKAREESTHLFRLNPRSGNSIQIIGMARDFGLCTKVIERDGSCTNFVDRRSGRPMCCEHSMHRFESKQSYSFKSKVPLGPISDYDLSNGMAIGSKAKQYTTKELAEDPNAPGGLLYDISVHYGRARENPTAQEGKVDELLEMRESLRKKIKRDAVDANSVRACTTELLSESRMRHLAHQKHAGQREAMANAKTAKGVLDNVIIDSAGAKVIEASRQAMEKMRSEKIKAAEEHTLKRKRISKDSIIDSKKVDSSAIEPMEAKLSASASRLLARRSISSAMLPKPKLHSKKIKLPPTVRPPPGQSFYAEESSDEELDEIMRREDVEQQLRASEKSGLSPAIVELSDSDSDLEIIK